MAPVGATALPRWTCSRCTYKNPSSFLQCQLRTIHISHFLAKKFLVQDLYHNPDFTELEKEPEAFVLLQTSHEIHIRRRSTHLS
eukprot:1359835-Amorphochlora_amoeboformis.AAC.2